MSDEVITLTTYDEVVRFVAQRLSVDGWEGDSEYYPCSDGDVSKGFLEIMLPVTDSNGRMLRGASGNGPIYVFLYHRGTWTYLGEMHGATVKANMFQGTTEFLVYGHLSSATAIERRYQLFGMTYKCVSEEEIVSE